MAPNNDMLFKMIHDLTVEHTKAVDSLDKLLSQLNDILNELKELNKRHIEDTDKFKKDLENNHHKINKSIKYLIWVNIGALTILLITVKDPINLLEHVFKFFVNLF